jgi:hypothetical protein
VDDPHLNTLGGFSRFNVLDHMESHNSSPSACCL